MYENILKYFSGDLSKSETSALLAAIKHDEALRTEFVRVQNIHGLSHLSPLSTDEKMGQRSLAGFWQRVERKKQQRTLRMVLQVAASIIILVGSTVMITLHWSRGPFVEQLNTLYVPPGQRAQLTLNDGSSVWLNANSKLTYPSIFAGGERRVSVEGEAYFTISPDKNRPFIVLAKNVEMKVLGTQFNVHSYPTTGFVKTNLVEGSLKVYCPENIANSVVLKPQEEVTVTANKMVVGKSTVADYYLWTEGLYVFEDESLIDIINKLQLYYDVKIVVEDPEIFNVRYTGKFRQRDGIDEILRIIQKIRKFSIRKDVENNIITLTK